MKMSLFHLSHSFRGTERNKADDSQVQRQSADEILTQKNDSEGSEKTTQKQIRKMSQVIINAMIEAPTVIRKGLLTLYKQSFIMVS